MNTFRAVVVFEPGGGAQAAVGSSMQNGGKPEEPSIHASVSGLTEEQANAVIRLAKFYHAHVSSGLTLKIMDTRHG